MAGSSGVRIRRFCADFAPSIAVGAFAVIAAIVLVHDGDYYVSRGVVAALYCLFIVGGGAAIIAVGRRWRWSVEACFLCVYVLMGLLNLVAVPPLATSDSYSQYLRAYEIAHGQLISPLDPIAPVASLPDGILGPNVPDYEMRDMLTHAVTPLDNPQGNIWHTMSLYSPVGFLPAAFAIGVVGLFGGSPWIAVYAARFATLLVTGAMLFFSIKTMPRSKGLFAFAALMPIFCELYASLSTDCLVIALTYALFAYVFKLRANRRRASIPLLVLLVVAISLVKIVYLPVCLLVVLVPAECFRGKRKKCVAVSILAALAILLNLAWLGLASGRLVEFQDGVDSAQQLAFVLSHPLAFAHACIRTTLLSGGSWVQMMFGHALNHQNVSSLLLFQFAMFVLFCYACFASTMRGGGERLERSARIVLLVIVALVLMLTYASLYLQWTAVGLDVIEGILGRYFIPILPLAIVGLFPCESCWRPRNAWLLWFFGLALTFLAPIELAL